MSVSRPILTSFAPQDLTLEIAATNDDNQRFLSIAEVTRRLGVSVRSLSRLRENGLGPPFVKIGRRVTYNPARLAEWIDRQESASAINAATEQ